MCLSGEELLAIGVLPMLVKEVEARKTFYHHQPEHPILHQSSWKRYKWVSKNEITFVGKVILLVDHGGVIFVRRVVESSHRSPFCVWALGEELPRKRQDNLTYLVERVCAAVNPDNVLNLYKDKEKKKNSRECWGKKR
ncbi:hypothetical protein VNO78_00429 [Psophocarpus tetragonolobus]|uniref:Uncharacterized protein n=1 Tax=Psophocarpus tetragonolobus TaxID=3891 RepID=A0AAN9SX19_PSOTE